MIPATGADSLGAVHGPSHRGSSRTARGVAGILLTGGQSRRMGTDKATLLVSGENLSARLGRLLAAVTQVAIEVGPGSSGLSAVQEDPPGGGPLAALVAGLRALEEDEGWRGPAVVLSCDLPLLDLDALDVLARWPGQNTVAPVLRGRVQPLCARWSRYHLLEASARLATGARSFGELPSGPTSTLLPETNLSSHLRRAFSDADTPEQLAALLAGAGRCPS